MMGIFFGWKSKRLRQQILIDQDLTEDQRELALQRLGEKTQPFSALRIAEDSQGIFHQLLPKIAAEIQLKRLKTRNALIAEMRTTLDELAETKKSWERLKNIDAELAAEQFLTYQEQQEKEAEHGKQMLELERDGQKISQEMETANLRAQLEQEKLQGELEQLRAERGQSPLVEGSELEQLEVDFKLKKRKAKLESAVKQIEWEGEQKRKKVAAVAGRVDSYQVARSAIEGAGLDEEGCQRALRGLNEQYGVSVIE